MNRRLQNTLTALTTSVALLVLGLVAALPVSPQPTLHVPAETGQVSFALATALDGPVIDDVAVTDDVRRATQVDPGATRAAARTEASRLGAEIAAAAALATALRAASAAADSEDTETLRSPRSTARRHRQTVVMPYFSFAPRG